jgi:hypothetical protein
MTQMRLIVALFVVINFSAFGAWDYQFARFMSQSTQGAPWGSTANIIKEEMHVTVHRNYLDVEHDLIIMAGGQSRPATNSDALEVVGDISLRDRSVVVGMLLWNNDVMLKAKLQHKNVARQKYEEVVDRHVIVPPRPRDPVILEYIDGNRYRISVFPFTFLGSRHLRMRYLIPKSNIYGRQVFSFPHPFTQNGKITIVKGYDTPKVNISYLYFRDTTTVVTDSITLDHVNFMVSPTTPEVIELPKPSEPVEKNTTSFTVVKTHTATMPGEIVRVSDFSISTILDSVRARCAAIADSVAGKIGIYAVVGDGAVSCSTGVSTFLPNLSQLYTQNGWITDLNIYSSSPLKPEVHWRVYLDGELFFSYTETPKVIESPDSRMESTLIAASNKIISLNKTLPRSMAATFGFVDTAFALLALEEDIVPKTIASQYERAGVPPLDREDIYTDSADIALVPAEKLFQENQYENTKFTSAAPDALKVAQGPFAGFTLEVLFGKIVIHLDKNLQANLDNLEISIYAVSGRKVMTWRNVEKLAGGSLEWSPRANGFASGPYIVCFKSGAISESRIIVVPR